MKIYKVKSVTPTTAVKFTRLSVYLTCFWPPPQDASIIQVVMHEIFFFTSVLLSAGLLFPLVLAINKYSDDSFVVMKTAILISGVVNFIIKIVTVRIHRKKIQSCGNEMERFIENADKMEMNILQKYIDKCWKFHGSITVSYYLSAIGVICGPLILPQRFPSDAVYPFSTNSTLVYCLVYFHQSLVGLQCSAAMAMDCQAALFLWYMGARFEMLAASAANIANFEDMKHFITRHQSLLRYADEVSSPIRIVALTTVMMTRVGIIFSSIMLISDQPPTVKIQFIVLAISATINIFVCVWAAENLIHVSGYLMANKIFYTSLKSHLKFSKNWSFVIHRTHKPVVIKVAGFLNELSYEYYSSFLSTVFSYFTAARAVIG